MSCVDVVIPCYKYAHYLRACVKSVLDQQGVDVRVLIIDDCSPDNTPEVAAQLVAEDARITFYRHETNRGHIETYNEGLLGWASSEYCLLLSADDLLITDALKRATRVMDAHPEVSMTYGRAIHTPDPAAESSVSTEGQGTRVLSGSQFIRLSCEEATNLVPTPTAVVRTRCQHQVGGYRKNLPHSGDMEMWLRLAAIGSVGVVDAELALYRVHATNMSVNYEGTRDLRAKHDALASVFREYGNQIPQAIELRQIAMQVLANRAFQTAGAHFDARKSAKDIQEYLNLAVEINPAIIETADWAKFRMRRRLGVTLWNTMAGIKRALTGNNPTQPQPIVSEDAWLRSPWVRSQHCA